MLLEAAASAGQRFDLLITDDAAVPGASLSGFVQRLKSKPENRNLKVFYIGERAGVPDTCQQKTLGIASCLSTAVCQSALLNAMTDCFVDTSDTKAMDLASEDQSDPSSDLAGKRVLLAEDNRTNQLFAREVLKHAGMQCDCVVNGEEALVAVRLQAYDLILMDCQMPEMDGFEATRAIRQMERDGELEGRLPIIALTANVIKGDRERCLEAGMDDYISKPFEAQQLLELIAKFFNTEPLSPTTGETDQQQSAGSAESTDPGIVPPINHEELLARCMGNLDFALELLADFEADLPSRIEEVSRFIAESNAEGVGEAAHSLKGAAGIVGAEEVRRVAAAIESSGKSGRLEDVAALLDELNAETRRFFDAVPEIRTELASPPSI